MDGTKGIDARSTNIARFRSIKLILSVSDIVGLPGLPCTNRGIRDWLQRSRIPVEKQGNRFVFTANDLPEPVRHACQLRLVEGLNLPHGTYDDDAHMALAKRPVSVQNTAYLRTSHVIT